MDMPRTYLPVSDKEIKNENEANALSLNARFLMPSILVRSALFFIEAALIALKATSQDNYAELTNNIAIATVGLFFAAKIIEPLVTRSPDQCFTKPKLSAIGYGIADAAALACLFVAKKTAAAPIFFSMITIALAQNVASLMVSRQELKTAANINRTLNLN